MSPNPSAPPVSPASPKSSPTSLPTSSLFLPPAPSPSSMSNPQPSPPQGPDVDAGQSWFTDSEASGISDPSDAPSDTPSAGSKPSPVSKAGLRAVVGQAVRTITNAVAAIAASEAERGHDLWRADADDVDGISAPASRIVYRRLPEEARDSDALDLFGVALALAAYLAKNLRAKAAIRAELAAGNAPAATPAQ